MCPEEELGTPAVIAVHDTTLGPAVGGVRFAPYPSIDAAVTECTRLAEGMTLKNAAAGLPFGGAKSVIVRNGPVDRTALMRSFARSVAELDGDYIPGVDVGTTIEDLALMEGIAPDVSCSREDPSPWTALGVLAGIRAAAAHLGEEDLRGVSVGVQGAGHVGAELVRLLSEEGADVRVSDIDLVRVASLVERYGATPVDPRSALFEPCDVFAPCAMAKVITAENAGSLNCRIVAGAANDTLATEDAADRLAESGVLYVPDFIVNAGGVIHIHALRQDWTDDELRAAVLEIGDRVGRILGDAETHGRLPLWAAKEVAHAALGRDREAVPAT